MADASTYLLLATVATVAVTIYMFDPKAPPLTHSQPKFVQMNKVGDEPYMTIYNSSVYKNLSQEDRVFSGSGNNWSGW